VYKNLFDKAFFYSYHIEKLEINHVVFQPPKGGKPKEGNPMYCPKCTHTVIEGSRFCIHCGFNLISESPGGKTIVERVEATVCESPEDFSEKTKLMTSAVPDQRSEKLAKPSKPSKPIFFGWLVSMGGPDKGKDYRILKEKTSIGKSEDSDIVITSDFVSRNHAFLSYEDHKFTLNDLESTNHTFVNEKKISRRILKDDDLIKFGDALYKFKCL